MATRHLKAALERLRAGATERPAPGGIRPMRFSDVLRVTAIERRAYDYPWSAGIFRDCLRAGYVCRVLERDRVIVGYGIMSAALDEAHILNVCLDPGYQGHGLGRALVLHLLTQAARAKAHAAYLEVRPSNRAARALYAGLGFAQVGLRKDYYPAAEGREDALILVRELD